MASIEVENAVYDGVEVMLSPENLSELLRRPVTRIDRGDAAVWGNAGSQYTGGYRRRPSGVENDQREVRCGVCFVGEEAVVAWGRCPGFDRGGGGRWFRVGVAQQRP